MTSVDETVMSPKITLPPAFTSSKVSDAGITRSLLGTTTALLLWYGFNGAFNVSNKAILNDLRYPWIISWIQASIRFRRTHRKHRARSSSHSEA